MMREIAPAFAVSPQASAQAGEKRRQKQSVAAIFIPLCRRRTPVRPRWLAREKNAGTSVFSAAPSALVCEGATFASVRFENCWRYVAAAQHYFY